ncbi:MAG: FCD domain-containing protein, partial [Pseudomonadota bacterium]
QFHCLICELGDTQLAIDTIENCRQKTDRMCVLSLERDTEIIQLIDDHRALLDSLEKRDVAAAKDITRVHLSRLDDIIHEVRKKHADFFE